MLHSEVRRDAHLCNLFQQQWPPLHPPLHFFNLLLVLLPALHLLFPAENTELWVILLHSTAHAAVMLLSGYLNSLSLVCCICERARWGSLAWARLDTTLCSFFSLCFCLSFHRSSSSSAFFLCSSAFLLRETIWSQMQGGLDGMGWDFRRAGAGNSGWEQQSARGCRSCFGGSCTRTEGMLGKGVPQ